MALASTLVSSKQTQGEPSLTGTDGSLIGFANTALSLWGKGADIYKQVSGKGVSVQPSGQVTQAAAPAAESKSFVPWLIGGGVLLVVVFFLMRKA